MPGANFQFIIETLLRSPNVRGFAGEFESTMRRIRSQAASGVATPAGASRELRQSLASAEAATVSSARAGLISPREAVLIRRHFRQQYDEGVAEARRIIGDEVTKASRKQIRGDVVRQVGRTDVITPSFQTDPAQPRRSFSQARTRIQQIEAQIALADEEYVQERARLISTLRRLRTAENRAAESLETPAIRADRAAVAAEQARNRRAARLGLERLEAGPVRGEGGRFTGRRERETDVELDARLDAEALRQYNQRRLRRLRTSDAVSERTQAETNIAQRQVTDRIREQERLIQRENSARATGFQRLLGLAHDRPGRTVSADREQLPGQFFASRLLTTASYGASAAVLYGFVNALREGAKEALALQRVTEQLRAQMESLGQGDQFRDLRREFLGIARDTGVLGSEVVFVGLQMRGAFGDTELAVQRTAEAIRAAQVSGLPLAEVVDSLTAASISYGVSIDDISDKALGLQERFGVTAQQSIKSFGDISTVAEQAGLSLNEVAGILGVIQQRSGRGLGAITEGLSRILPSIQEKAADILLFADQQASLRGQVPELQRDIAGGRSGQVLLTLARAWDQLDESAKKTVITMLGGRREAQYLIPLFEGSAKVLEEAARGEEDAGKAAEYQAAQSRTLGYQLGRLRQELNQIADSFGRLGVLEGLQLLAAGAVNAVGVLGDFVEKLAELNDMAAGIPGRMLAIAFAVRTLTRAIQAAAAIRTVIAGLGVSSLAGAVPAAAGASRLGQAGNLALGATGLPGIGRLIGSGAARLGAGGIATYAGGSALAATGVGLVGVAAVGVGLTLLQRQLRQNREQQQRTVTALRRQIDSLIATGRLAEDEMTKAEQAALEREQGPAPRQPRTPTKSYDELYREAVSRRRNPPRRQDDIQGIDFQPGGRVELEFSDRDEEAGQINEAYEKALREATEARFAAAVKLGLFGSRTRFGGKFSSDEKMLEAATLLRGLSSRDKRRLDKQIAGSKALGDAIASAGAEQVQTASELAESYATGSISREKYVTSLERMIALLKGGGDATREAMLAVQRQLRQFFQEEAQAYGELAATNATIAVGADPTAAQQAQLQRTLAGIRRNVVLSQPHSDVQGRQAEAEYALALQQADKADADAAEQRAISHLEFQLALTEDPQQQARIRQSIAALKVRYANADEIDAARAEQAQANQQAREAERAVTDARFGLREAQAGENDQLLATIAQERAAEAIARARGAGRAAQIEAMAAKIRADRQMEAYLLDASRARRELAIAVAESLGNLAEVGRLTVEQANEDLRVMRERFARGEVDQADVDRADINRVNAEAAERTRAREDRIGDLEYLYEFDRITAGELIRGLTYELSLIPETNKTARREIERRIKAIRDEMGRDMQFGALGPITLPTEYEVNRLVAAGGASGYQAGRIGSFSAAAQPGISGGDYRSYSFDITVNNQGDLDGAVAKITEVTGGASRYGTRSRQFAGQAL